MPLPYEQWVPQWTAHLRDTAAASTIPPSARRIHTPLILKCWQYHLVSHPNKDLVDFFLHGISQEFRIGFKGSTSSLHSARKNLKGATLHPEVIVAYIKDELALNRVFGPYSRHQCPFVQISRFGVIPKSHQPNKWRLIIDLSPQCQ